MKVHFRKKKKKAFSQWLAYLLSLCFIAWEHGVERQCSWWVKYMLQRLGKVTEQLLLSNFLSRCWKLKISPRANNTVLVTHDCFAGVKPTWLLLTRNETSLADGYLGDKSLHNLQYRSGLRMTGALTQTKHNFKLWAFAEHAMGIPAVSGKLREFGGCRSGSQKIPACKQTAAKQQTDFTACRYSSGTTQHSSAGPGSFVLIIWGFTSEKLRAALSGAVLGREGPGLGAASLPRARWLQPPPAFAPEFASGTTLKPHLLIISPATPRGIPWVTAAAAKWRCTRGNHSQSPYLLHLEVLECWLVKGAIRR